MCHIARKPALGIYNQVRHKPSCICRWLEANEVKGLHYIYIANTKALISCTVTFQLIFAFVETKCRFSHDTAKISLCSMLFKNNILIKLGMQKHKLFVTRMNVVSKMLNYTN